MYFKTKNIIAKDPNFEVMKQMTEFYKVYMFTDKSNCEILKAFDTETEAQNFLNEIAKEILYADKIVYLDKLI